MLNENYLIRPSMPIGKNVSTFMLSKKFFQQYPENKITRQNYHALLETLINLPIVQLNQVHGNRISEVIKRGSVLIKNSDGVYTKSPNLVLTIKTADCLPLILSSEDGREILALHIGWRGLYKDIIDRALQLLESKLEEVTAWLGPSISSKNYLVGKDVYDSFLKSDKKSFSSFKKATTKDKWLFSLRDEACRRLKENGIKTITSEICTYEDKESFFSYRRDGTSERMITLVWRNNEK